MTYDDCFPPIIVGAFNDANTERIVNQILQEAVRDPEATITLYINSDGGYLDALAPIVEVIEKMPNPLRTVCFGRAISAGAYLLAYGDERWCGPNSYVMIHEISGGTGGHVKDHVISARETERVNRHWVTKLAENCGITYDEIQKRLRRVAHRDLYLNAQEAKQFGIVDHVGLPQFNLVPRIEVKPKRKGRSR